jgi:hypothetical protein
MKLNNEQYSALTQKLAAEIVSSVGMEVEANEDMDESIEVSAGVKEIAGNAAKLAKGYASTLTGKGVSAAKDAVKRAEGSPAGAQYVEELKRGVKDAKVNQGLAIAGTAAVANKAAGSIAAMKKRKQEKAAAEQEEGFDKEAAYIGSVIEKAAAVFDEAQLMKQAALEVLAEAESYENASMQVMDELGLLDDAE